MLPFLSPTLPLFPLLPPFLTLSLYLPVLCFPQLLSTFRYWKLSCWSVFLFLLLLEASVPIEWWQLVPLGWCACEAENVWDWGAMEAPSLLWHHGLQGPHLMQCCLVCVCSRTPNVCACTHACAFVHACVCVCMCVCNICMFHCHHYQCRMPAALAL